VIFIFVRGGAPGTAAVRGETPAFHYDGRAHLEHANRQVTDSERMVAEWSSLIDTMRAEGRDVTDACNLLKTFKDNLEVHRSSRDLIRERVAQAADELRWLPDNRAFP
jgi:hypothetical protein